MLTNLGNEENINAYVLEKLHRSITLKNVLVSNHPTIIKQRFVEPNFLTKMFEVQAFSEEPFSSASEEKIISLIHELAPKHDLIIVADYGHGFITSSIVKELVSSYYYLCLNTQTNSANLGYNLITKYSRADYICIDEHELKLAAGNKYCGIEEMINILRQRLNFKHILVSQGAYGTMAFTQNGAKYYTPVFSNKVVDRTGAGDALFSVTSPLIFLKCPIPILGLIANCVGALKVKTVCNREPVNSIQLKKFITALLA